ncbi:hypothetical protein SteCoe_20967 [Stentor coeruleus]|uniref:SUI1 domain-containing protein n=1 Tax=Stentor coeruleus TaxID=5963 RepID=A0A1R2BQF9_9CILI|nr:hypothetical protein SteCoe_20967 [Stentor coeruleus]
MEKPIPIEVIYCPICTFPIEYCEYSETFNECKKWLAINHPEAYPDLAEDFAKIRNGETIPEEEKKPASKPKKVRIAEKKQIVVSVLKRGSTKNITKVEGLKEFGINLKDTAKLFRKTFASGCAVVEESIEIQGELVDEIIEKILSEFPSVKEDDIMISDTHKTKKVNKGQKK